MKKIIVLILFVLFAFITCWGRPPNNKKSVGDTGIYAGYIVSGDSVVSDSFQIPAKFLGSPFTTQCYMYSVDLAGGAPTEADIQVNLIRGYSTFFVDTSMFGTDYNSQIYWKDTTAILAAASTDSTWYETDFTRDDTISVGLSGASEIKKFHMHPYNWIKLVMTGQTAGSPDNPDSSRILINCIFYTGQIEK